MSLLPPKLSRYAAGSDDPLAPAAEGKDDQENAEHLAADLEKLDPTFVKLAQVLSTRSELLPKP